ncbi:MAG: TetR/AcrR family transcriptional regulator [Candidatus Omnitrophica bacterium]|nr:TetR/AcrR family transcriptional regulator [Candidatus Omnitrophota bacterium]
MAKSLKRDEIIRVALELIAEHGFHGTSMAMVAEEAKVGAGTIYRYFESKDALIMALFKEAEIKMQEALTVKPYEHFSIRERFFYLHTSLLRYMINNPIHFKYLEQFFNSPYGIKFRRDQFLKDKKGESHTFLKLFSEGLSQGIMKNLPLVVLFALALGPIMDMARDHILGFFKLNDDLITQSVEACWDAVKK